MVYRREIDGLRAIAVLPVILFHAGFARFSGGFVGVDVFFVISGYLITTLILTDARAGRFTLLGFYERRARRILPALFLVMAVSIPFAWLWMLPTDLKDFSESLAAVATFWSNVLFWRESGYFDTASELKPMLHTWSLAVEEQYYLLFPPLVLLIWRLGRSWMLLILTAGALASLLLAERASGRSPAAAFFLLPTRGWELLFGAVIGYYLLDRTAPRATAVVRESMSVLGLLLIGVGVFAFNAQTPFPGVYALVPTVGTALLILFATAETRTGRVLGARPLVAIGLVSYSAYLWHQPLFAFARHRSLSEPGTGTLLVLSLAALLLAAISWRYVEVPFRDRTVTSRRTIVAVTAAGIIAFSGLGIAGAAAEGFGGRLPPNLTWDGFRQKVETLGDVCTAGPLASYPGLRACEFGDRTSPSTVVLYGDSHAQAVSYALHERLSAMGLKGVFVRAETCQTVPTVVDRRRADLVAGCLAWFDSLLAFVRDHASAVVIVSRWTHWLFPIDGTITSLAFDNGEGGSEVESYTTEYVALNPAARTFGNDPRVKAAAVEDMLRRMQRTGSRIVLVYPIPELGWHISKVNYLHYRRTGRVLDVISTSHDRYLERNAFIVDVFDRIPADARLIKIRPDEIFCDTFIPARCAGQVGTVPFYDDDDHLSDAGARLVVDRLMPHLH
ncbi:MAG: acyltransferase, partial [Acidimicrobiia bacterium]|nr:acyltransferase [Acidimicrobiia bacterium]